MLSLITRKNFVVALVLLTLVASPAFAAETALVDVRSVDRSIVLDLRYATPRNIAHRPLYPSNMPALVRPHVAQQLAKAQAILRERGYGLKIWDAWRPKAAHQELWSVSRNTDYVADPAMGGSLHTCGVAVDATLVDHFGRDVPMPTDFDEFSTAAMLEYAGDNAEVRRNLRILQNAMARAGFYGLRTEWWHFVARDWKDYPPIPEVTIVTTTAPTQKPAAAPKTSPVPVRLVTTGQAPSVSPTPAPSLTLARVPAVLPTPAKVLARGNAPIATATPWRAPTRGPAPVVMPTPPPVAQGRVPSGMPATARAATKGTAPVRATTAAQVLAKGHAPAVSPTPVPAVVQKRAAVPASPRVAAKETTSAAKPAPGQVAAKSRAPVPSSTPKPAVVQGRAAAGTPALARVATKGTAPAATPTPAPARVATTKNSPKAPTKAANAVTRKPVPTATPTPAQAATSKRAPQAESTPAPAAKPERGGIAASGGAASAKPARRSSSTANGGISASLPLGGSR